MTTEKHGPILIRVIEYEPLWFDSTCCDHTLCQCTNSDYG